MKITYRIEATKPNAKHVLCTCYNNAEFDKVMTLYDSVNLFSEDLVNTFKFGHVSPFIGEMLENFNVDTDNLTITFNEQYVFTYKGAAIFMVTTPTDKEFMVYLSETFDNVDEIAEVNINDTPDNDDDTEVPNTENTETDKVDIKSFVMDDLSAAMTEYTTNHDADKEYAQRVVDAILNNLADKKYYYYFENDDTYITLPADASNGFDSTMTNGFELIGAAFDVNYDNLSSLQVRNLFTDDNKFDYLCDYISSEIAVSDVGSYVTDAGCLLVLKF